jgi:hypothetical protein
MIADGGWVMEARFTRQVFFLMVAAKTEIGQIFLNYFTFSTTSISTGSWLETSSKPS